MKRTHTTITKEYDKDGNLVSEITETVEEEDTGYIYPQYPVYPVYPSWTGTSPFIYKTDITCDSDK